VLELLIHAKKWYSLYMTVLQGSSLFVVRVSHNAGVVLMGGDHAVVVGAETAALCSHCLVV
jgi:hypothetical protein